MSPQLLIIIINLLHVGKEDRATKNSHVFYFLNNRNKEMILPLFGKIVYTVDNIKLNHYDSNEDIHNNCF